MQKNRKNKEIAEFKVNSKNIISFKSSRGYFRDLYKIKA